jgi:hypothetical protein
MFDRETLVVQHVMFDRVTSVVQHVMQQHLGYWIIACASHLSNCPRLSSGMDDTAICSSKLPPHDCCGQRPVLQHHFEVHTAQLQS